MNRISIYNVLTSILIMIIGIVLVTNHNFVIGTISWIIGCLFILAGIIRSIQSLKDNQLNTISLYVGIIIIILGILLISFPNIIDVTIRIVFGGWILFVGIERMIFGLLVRPADRQGSNVFMITSLLMIVIGILVLIEFYSLVGIFLIIYACMDIIDYIVYSSRKTKYASFEDIPIKKKSKVTKTMKNKKAIEADIEE